MGLSNKIGDYVDGPTGVVTNPFENPFGDSVWRSSWLYASLLVLRGKQPTAYNDIMTLHSLTADSPAKFLMYFSQHGIGDNGWTVIGSDQQFSTDQLAPLLYLLECVSLYGNDAEKAPAVAILKSLLELQRTGTALSGSPAGKILPNLGYVIDVLCDQQRYNLIYRTIDLPIFLIPCFGNIECADRKRRQAYKLAFSAAVTTQSAGANLGQDEFSFFNAIALVTLQALAWGPGDSDVKGWRENFAHMAVKGGPAFQIAAGVAINDAAIEAYRSAMTCRDVDNDVIMSQRPSKFSDGTFPNPPCASNHKTATLDYVILKAARAAWN
jgi:hypothetical protein